MCWVISLRAIKVEFSERMYEQHHNMELFYKDRLFFVPTQNSEKGLGFDVCGCIIPFSSPVFRPAHFYQCLFSCLNNPNNIKNLIYNNINNVQNIINKTVKHLQYIIPLFAISSGVASDIFIQYKLPSSIVRIWKKKTNNQWITKSSIIKPLLPTNTNVCNSLFNFSNYECYDYKAYTNNQNLVFWYDFCKNINQHATLMALEKAVTTSSQIPSVVTYAFPVFYSMLDLLRLSYNHKITKCTNYINPLSIKNHKRWIYSSPLGGCVNSEIKYIDLNEFRENFEKILSSSKYMSSVGFIESRADSLRSLSSNKEINGFDRFRFSFYRTILYEYFKSIDASKITYYLVDIALSFIIYKLPSWGLKIEPRQTKEYPPWIDDVYQDVRKLTPSAIGNKLKDGKFVNAMVDNIEEIIIGILSSFI